MPVLRPGANALLPNGRTASLQLRTTRAHADLIVLCVRANGTADGDQGVALWSQPSCAAGAVTIDTATDSVTVRYDQLPSDVQRVLIVGQADGIPDLSHAGTLTAVMAVDGTEAVGLVVECPPPLPTVQLAELYRHSGGWKVRCLGDGYAEGLRRLLETHGITVNDEPETPTPPRQPEAPVRPASPAAPIDLEKRRRVDILKKVEATGSISLLKKVEAAAASIDKFHLAGQRAQVILVLDVSGSSRGLFKDGRYQALVERALAAGLLFDDDGTIQAYLFDSTVHEAPDVTLSNFQTWADGVIRRRGIWGGTRYAPPIEHIAGEAGSPQRLPTYVMFVTDGGNSDRRDATRAMKDASHVPVFWQFMAVGREEDFPFLRKLDDLKGRKVDNADFFAVENPAIVPDDQFFAQMMQEFPGWLQAARQTGILR